MTTIASPTLTESLRMLIDARLDTIDRMLVGRVHRQDRLAIVREVETQIYDLLQDRDHGSLDRDDVLAVLARLDPPEAYLPEDPGESPTGLISRPRSTTSRGRFQATQLSGLVGLASIGMLIVATAAYVLAATTQAMWILYFGTFLPLGLGFIFGLIAASTALYTQVRGGWSIVGLMAGTLGTLISMLAMGVVLCDVV